MSIKSAEDALREVLAVAMRDVDRMLLEHHETAQWQEAVAAMRAIQRDALEAAAEAANKIKRDYENTTFPNIYRECPWAVEKVVKAICKLQDGL